MSVFFLHEKVGGFFSDFQNSIIISLPDPAAAAAGEGPGDAGGVPSPLAVPSRAVAPPVFFIGFDEKREKKRLRESSLLLTTRFFFFVFADGGPFSQQSKKQQQQHRSSTKRGLSVLHFAFHFVARFRDRIEVTSTVTDQVPREHRRRESVRKSCIFVRRSHFPSLNSPSLPPSPSVPKRTSLADAKLPSGPVMAVSVCPQRGPGASPTQGNLRGRGTGAGGVEEASTSASGVVVVAAAAAAVAAAAPPAVATFMLANSLLERELRRGAPGSEFRVSRSFGPARVRNRERGRGGAELLKFFFSLERDGSSTSSLSFSSKSLVACELGKKSKRANQDQDEHADERAPARRRQRRRLWLWLTDTNRRFPARPVLSRVAHAIVLVGRRSWRRLCSLSGRRRRLITFRWWRRRRPQQQRRWPRVLHQAREPCQAQARAARSRVGEGAVSVFCLVGEFDLIAIIGEKKQRKKRKKPNLNLFFFLLLLIF